MEQVQAAVRAFKKPEKQQHRINSIKDHHDSMKNGNKARHFELQWHQEQAGIISNGCRNETACGQACQPQHHDTIDNRARRDSNDYTWWNEHGAEAMEGLYWQLYKSLAAFRMAETKENQEGE